MVLLGKSGCIRAKLCVFGQTGSTRAKLVVFGQTGSIRAKLVEIKSKLLLFSQERRFGC